MKTDLMSNEQGDKVFMLGYNKAIEEFKTEGYRKRIFQFGYEQAKVDFEKMIDSDIKIQRDMMKNKPEHAKSGEWRIIGMQLLKQQLQKLKDKSK